MVRITLATLSVAALAAIAVNAQPINATPVDLAERGAFGRLGAIFRPLISGHLKAHNNARRELDAEEDVADLLSREDLESLEELVERGAFGRLGRIFRPLIAGHLKANNARRELDVEDELNDLVAREDYESIEELVERGAFGRLGAIFRPLITGHLKAHNNARRELDVEDELNELLAREDYESIEELVERGAFGRLGAIFRPLITGHLKAHNNARRELDEFDEVLERSFGEDSLDEMD